MIDQYGNEIDWVPRVEDDSKQTTSPKYILIAKSIEDDIQQGRLLHGAKLPPQRVIANYLGINHGTVTRAYKLCEEKGLLKGVIGKGTFVSGSAGLPVDLLTDHDDKNIISFGMALPVYELNEKVELMVKEVIPYIDYNIALKYCPPEGHLKHRYIASNWLKQYKIDSTPENIIISAGTQNALAIILITLFSKSDRIIVDEYTYTGLKSLSKYLGIILVPVKSDENGMCVEALEQTCKRENAKGIYLMPDCHNPTSIVLSESKRDRLSEVIRKYNLLLIEDGTCSFTAEKKYSPISSRLPNNSFYIHGTSKTISPTFRISYIVSPSNYIKRLQKGINNLIWLASPYTAEIMALLQSTGKYDLIETAKLDILKERNYVFNDIFEGFDFIYSETSLFRYLQLPDHKNESQIEKIALKAGVQVFSVNRFLAGMNENSNAIRVSISSARNCDELRIGLNILKQLLLSTDEMYEPIV